MHVNILMATFNGERFVAEQLDSIIDQTHTNWDLYISDDGSTDSTLSVLAAYAARDSRIHVCPSIVATGSASTNFLSAISRMPENPLMLSDQDDRWFPNKVALSLAALAHAEASSGAERPILIHTDAQIVGTDLSEISRSMKRYTGTLRSSASLRQSLVENNVTGNATLLNAALVRLLKTDQVPENVIMHDWWIHLVAAAFGDVLYLDIPTLAYRQHGSNVLGARSSAKFPTLLRTREAMQRNAATVAQARTFLAIHGFRMSEADRSCVYSYAHITAAPWWKRSLILGRFGVVKSSWGASIMHRLCISLLRED